MRQFIIPLLLFSISSFSQTYIVGKSDESIFKDSVLVKGEIRFENFKPLMTVREKWSWTQFSVYRGRGEYDLYMFLYDYYAEDLVFHLFQHNYVVGNEMLCKKEALQLRKINSKNLTVDEIKKLIPYTEKELMLLNKDYLKDIKPTLIRHANDSKR